MAGFPQPVTPIYLDLNTLFTGALNTYYTVNFDAIAIQIFNLFTTTIGECEGEPTFGSLLPYRLFEPIDDITSWEIETDLYIAVNYWLGDRISTSSSGISVIPDPTNRRFLVTVVYTVQLSGAIQSLTLALNSMRSF